MPIICIQFRAQAASASRPESQAASFPSPACDLHCLCIIIGFATTATLYPFCHCLPQQVSCLSQLSQLCNCRLVALFPAQRSLSCRVEAAAAAGDQSAETEGDRGESSEEQRRVSAFQPVSFTLAKYIFKYLPCCWTSCQAGNCPGAGGLTRGQ